jgi:pimeloyl-ACP methyl ester carboxylesterase
MYPGLGHIPMEEAPERVLADLRAFLGTHAAPKAGTVARV